MRHIVSMWRLTLRKILTALMGVTAFLFGACPLPDIDGPKEYGPGPARDHISGTVIGNGEPVSGIKVSIQIENNSNPYTYTKENGEFGITVQRYENGSYTLFFQDVDGPLNGEFDSQTVQWTSGDGPLNIVLNPKESEPEN